MKLLKWYRRVKLRRQLKITVKTLKTLDVLMNQVGYSRQQRRAFWRTISKSQKNIIQYLANMAGETNK